MNTRPRMILIDVDGTLVDSVPDLAYCVDEMMRALGRAPHGEAKVRNWVGNGVEKLVKRALADDLDAEPAAADFERDLERRLGFSFSSSSSPAFIAST